MRLTKLIEAIGLPVENITGDPDILGITEDSRRVESGFLFVAISGVRFDGINYLQEAVRRGASAVLIEEGKTCKAPGVTVVSTSRDLRHSYSLLAAQLYDMQPKSVVAVTGTNGKTSVVSFLRQIWSFNGIQAASLGTLGLEAPAIKHHDWPAELSKLTTPEPVLLHQTLEKLASYGVERVALEASSHGLDQYRLHGVKVTAAGFTNLSRDHMDYHDSMTSYLESKLRLFNEVMAPGGVAVLNRGSSVFNDVARACENRGHDILHYGSSRTGRLAGAINLLKIDVRSGGVVLTLEFETKVEEVFVPLAGYFQAENVLCALGLAMASDISFESAVSALPTLAPARGRMELVGYSENGAAIAIDYAHSPDALKNALAALRQHCDGRLVLVFGCGGDRDQGKREEMGKIAFDLADTILVTDDNPRTENPAAIRRDVIKGCPEALEIPNREEAIQMAIGMLCDGDLLLVAGKGHESYQIVGGEQLEHSDFDVVRRVIKNGPQ